MNSTRLNTTCINSKQIREYELKIHEKLYGNIKLLTHFYTPSKDFQSVFKPNMFSKINKSAFQHVIYYLFCVLNPEETKTQIKNYPLFDVKQESLFRSEVISYIQWINAQYDYAKIPVLMTSQLVSPQGVKFARFMLKLSIFVMLEHLRKKGLCLGLVRPHKNTKMTEFAISNIKKITDLNESKIAKLQDAFEVKLSGAHRQAEDILYGQMKAQSELSDVRKILEEKKKQSTRKNDSDVREKLEILEMRMGSLRKVSSLCSEGLSSLNAISNNSEIAKHQTDKIDLCKLFRNLNGLLAGASVDLPFFSKDELQEMRIELEELNQKGDRLEEKYSKRKDEMCKFVLL